MDEPTQAAKEPKGMELVIERLSNILSESTELSEGFYNKASNLEHFNCGQDKKDSEEQIRKDGAIPRIMELLSGLNEVNQRNREILNQLNRHI